MRAHAEAWLDAGAVALSAGLDYAPSWSATTDELVELAGLLRPTGGRYAAHARYRLLGRPEAIRETIEIGRRAGVGVVISHERIDDELEAVLDGARDVDVALDSHLYPAGCTHLTYHVPQADQAGGPDAIVARLAADPAMRERVAAHLDGVIADGAAAGAREVVSATASGRWAGRELASIAGAWRMTPGEAAVRLLLDEGPDVLLIYHWGVWGRTDAEFAPIAARTLRHPATIVASDGVYRPGLPHPRGYGTFPRVLAMVRDAGATSWGRAVHAMSGRPAQVYGLPDRGVIRSGALAHAVVFDPAIVAAGATWDQPTRPPVGVDAVIVNGVVAVRDGVPTGALMGRVTGG
jgi:N-acyl-D-amino-acid deacylase